MNRPSSVIHGAVVVPPGGRPHIGYWCPWCEGVHTHGLGGMPASDAVGRSSGRGAHCSEGRSPHAGRGVDIALDRLVRSHSSLEPPGPFVPIEGTSDREGLREIVSGAELEAVVARFLFGRPPTAEAYQIGRSITVDLVGGSLTFTDGGEWVVVGDDGNDLATGHDLLGLLARLFGLPPGVAFVRVGAAALGVDLPPDTALAVAAAIDHAFVPTSEEVSA